MNTFQQRQKETRHKTAAKSLKPKCPKEISHSKIAVQELKT